MENKHDVYRGKDCMRKFVINKKKKISKEKNEVINKRAERI